MRSNLSAELVGHLVASGYSYSDIARIGGLSVPFVSRVARRERSFTMAHLEVFEKKLGQPLFLLLMAARDPRSLPPPLRKLYNEAKRIMRSSAKLRAMLKHDPKAPAPRAKKKR